MRKKPIWDKIFVNQKSCELSAHFQLISFELILCRFLGILEFQIKSDETRVIKSITMSSWDIFEFYTKYISIKNYNKVWSRIVRSFLIINGGTNFWYFFEQKLYMSRQLLMLNYAKFTLTSKSVSDKILWLALNPEPVNLF